MPHQQLTKIWHISDQQFLIYGRKCKKQLDLESCVFANFLTVDRRAKWSQKI